MADLTDVRDAVRDRYAAAAQAVGAKGDPSCCGIDGCAPVALVDKTGTEVFDSALSDDARAH